MARFWHGYSPLAGTYERSLAAFRPERYPVAFSRYIKELQLSSQSLSISRRVFAAITSWFDTDTSIARASKSGKSGMDWIRSIPFIAMHAMCLGVIWVGWSWTAVAVAVALYFVRMFAITGFYHRYFSHRTFKTSRAFQFVMALWGSTCTQKGPLWWAAHHRHHHRHSDEEDDLHSPHQDGLYWSHMGWITARENAGTNLKAVPDLAKYPELMFLNRFDTLVPVLFAASLFFLGKALAHYAPGLGTSGAQMLIWGYFISTVVLFHGTCTINSLSHLFGKRRYATTDDSRNNFILALITLGEGWHNNHHRYPASTRQGFYWWEVDITYYGLKALSWTGLIWDLNPVPEKVRVTRLLTDEAPKAAAKPVTKPAMPKPRGELAVAELLTRSGIIQSAPTRG